MEHWESDKELYDRMHEPLTQEAVNLCAKRFYEGIKKLREECHVSDLGCVVEFMVLPEKDGEKPTRAASDLSFGNIARIPDMLSLAHRRATGNLIEAVLESAEKEPPCPRPN